MTRKAKAPAHKKPAAKPVDTPAADEASEATAGEGAELPDGFYSRSPNGTRGGGPFETPELARGDLDATDLGPVEGLQEAESAIGVADWIDPETGEPAEGLSTPRLGEE